MILRNLIVFFAIILLVRFDHLIMGGTGDEVISYDIVYKRYSMEEKRGLLLDMAIELDREYGLAVGVGEFADMCMVVLYCESNLEPTTVSRDGTQFGINQLTVGTINHLGIPMGVENYDFSGQLRFFKKFLVATGRISDIRSTIDLHVLNFAPSVSFSRDSICGIGGNGLSALDMNRNLYIDRDDFIIFQRKRCMGNKFIRVLYEGLDGERRGVGRRNGGA